MKSGCGEDEDARMQRRSMLAAWMGEGCRTGRRRGCVERGWVPESKGEAEAEMEGPAPVDGSRLPGRRGLPRIRWRVSHCRTCTARSAPLLSRSHPPDIHLGLRAQGGRGDPPSVAHFPPLLGSHCSFRPSDPSRACIPPTGSVPTHPNPLSSNSTLEGNHARALSVFASRAVLDLAREQRRPGT